MLADMTPAVARALESAQCWSVRLGAAAVEPEHVLHGLLDEEEGRAAVLLTKAGLNLAGFRKAFAGRGAGVAAPANTTSLPLAPKTEKAFSQARQLTRELSADRTLASEQVVLGLLREDETLCQALATWGFSMARLEAELLSAQGPPLRLDEPLCLDEPAEKIDTARILDAAANRAREGLRVIEDYCRFVLDDQLLSRELKQLRHDLAEVLSRLSPQLLLEARETLRDVGTGLTTAREPERLSLLDVVQANLKRLQETLRSLEEFGKLQGTDLGRALEKLRYRSYTLERALVLGASARERLAQIRLCVLVTTSLCTASLEWTIEQAAAGGAGMIQLREKKLDDRTLLERAQRVRRCTRKTGLLFIMNDRPDLARLAEADGVHLGQTDLPVKEARRIVGAGALVGVSTHTIEQVRQAVFDGASYIGVGPAFPSSTKGFGTLAGVEFVRQATAETSLPAFVIGGVNLATIAEAVTAGAQRVAVSQAICQAENPRQVAAEFSRYLGRSKSDRV